MTSNQKYPNWFLWIYEHFALVLLAGMGLAVAFLGFAIYIENRLTNLEEDLTMAPPRSYVAPDLGDFGAGDMTSDRFSQRHQVYVPCYSHIYYQSGSAYSLETTLSLRNVDSKQSIYVESVEYYNTNGKLAKTLVDRIIKLKPLETIEFLIERRDSSGGSGANFLVRWGSTAKVDPPLIEAVMVGTSGTQGISFARTGVEVTLTDE